MPSNRRKPAVPKKVVKGRAKATSKGKISLYPLELETALGAVIATGPMHKKQPKRAVDKKR